MSTEQIWQTTCADVEASLSLARHIGSRLRGGEVIELASDVGGGKTTFTKGVVQAAGSDDNVHSPSFTISNTYRAGKLCILHFDFYRLDDPGIMAAELAEQLDHEDTVVIVEWAAIVDGVLPKERLQVTITPTSETGREFTFTYPDKYHYLLEGLR